MAHATAGSFNDGVAAYKAGDYATAARLWTPHAEQGDAQAQYYLGVMYANGQGVRQDYVQAHMWLNLAAAQGHPVGVKNRDYAATLMTPEQIAEAQQLARDWIAAHPR